MIQIGRVLFLSAVADFRGGAERSLFDLMDTPGVEPILIVPETGPISEMAASRNIQTKEIDLGKVGQIRRPFYRPFLWSVLDVLRVTRQIAKFASVQRVRVVHSNGLKVSVLACMARMLTWIPTIVHIRDVPRTFAEKIIWLGMALSASQVIIVSSACWPFRWRPKKVRIILNGIKVSSEELQTRKFGNPLRIGFIGRIHPDKGLHTLVDWISFARKQGLPLELVVRGEAHFEHQDYVADVKSQIMELGLTKFCKFDGWKENTSAVYRELDVVAVPSQQPDPLPRVIMEAFKFGVPVIATPTGGIVNMIQDRTNGCFAQNASEFVDALKFLTQSQDWYNHVRVSARCSVREEMSIDKLHSAIHDLYTQVGRQLTF